MRVSQVEPGQVTMYGLFSIFCCFRFGTRQDRNGSEVWHMHITEMHTVRQMHTRPTSDSQLCFYCRRDVQHRTRWSLIFIFGSISEALLLLYDITSRTSFDNIRVSLGELWKWVVREKLTQIKIRRAHKYLCGSAISSVGTLMHVF